MMTLQTLKRKDHELCTDIGWPYTKTAKQQSRSASNSLIIANSTSNSRSHQSGHLSGCSWLSLARLPQPGLLNLAAMVIAADCHRQLTSNCVSHILGIKPTCKDVSSWKWVAKRVGQPMTSMMCSDMAQARPNPSYVDVPRPSSSMMTRDLSVAPCKSIPKLCPALELSGIHRPKYHCF